MSRLQSQIPRLKPASSCGNLSQLHKMTEKPKSHHGSRQNLHTSNNTGTDRTPMINAPTPVTHRRMYHNYNLTNPPWAIDDTISPFDPEPEKPKKKNYNRITQSDFREPRNNLMEFIPNRIEPPSPSSDYIHGSFPNNEYHRNISEYGDTSYSKSEIPNYFAPPTPSMQVSACQTDLTGMDLNYIQNSKNKMFQPVLPTQIQSEKRMVLPLKELKRNSHRNYQTYKVSNKNYTNHDPVNLEKIFNVPERLSNPTDEDIQSRIDYWLNKNINLDQTFSDKPYNPNVKTKSLNTDTKKPIYRNEITFTPRPMNNQFSSNNKSPKLISASSNPQMIEAVIFQSDSESEKDCIVSSRSIESKNNRPSSHFTIRANLASKSESSNNDLLSNAVCGVCNLQLSHEDQTNYCGIRYHKNCFKCFLCKKKLSLNNCKISGGKLYCPLHYRFHLI